VTFWSWLTGAGAVPNATVGDPDSVGPTYRPGDPNGVELEDAEGPVQARMATVVPSPWDGWPATWAAPSWSSGALGSKVDELVDVAWAALDLNSSVLSAMPVYRTRGGRVLPSTAWMSNPDPNIYTDWSEFAKQLFWDFQLGEAFVLPMSWGSDNKPYTFRVIPPPLVNVEMAGGRRVYNIGSLDVTSEILHIRYKSQSDSARGVGPLDLGRTRLVAATMLARYASDFAAGGGVPKYILETDLRLTRKEVQDLLDQWWEARMASAGEPWKPGMMSHGLKAKTLQLSPQEMGLVDLAQYSEARIAVLLGVPPFLLGLPTNDPMTYSNVSQLFDFHDRRFLKTAAVRVMSALSGWALPRGQSVELNRDEYSRPALAERAEAYTKLAALGVLSAQEIRVMERLVDADPPNGDGVLDDGEDLMAAEALTGGGRS
jgi:HK97 family phage portal protein